MTRNTSKIPSTFEAPRSENLQTPLNSRFNIFFPPLFLCAEVKCGSINAPTNGAMQCRTPTGNAPVSADVAYMEHNTICYFTCTPGYTIHGSDSVTCTHERTWTSPTPLCKRECPDGGAGRMRASVVARRSGPLMTRGKFVGVESFFL